MKMLRLIILLVIGAVMVYIAQDNLTQVTLHLASYAFPDIPLFYIIVGSLLTGLSLGYIVSLVTSIFTGFTIRGKNKKIKQTKSEIVNLTKRIHQLELESEKLKNNSATHKPTDKNAL